MPNTEKPVDKIAELCENLIRAGLNNLSITKLGNELKLDFANDFLRLSPVAQNKAYKAAVEGSNRHIIEFVKQVMNELSEAAEMVEDDGVSVAPPKPKTIEAGSLPSPKERIPNRENSPPRAGDPIERSTSDNSVKSNSDEDDNPRQAENSDPLGGPEADSGQKKEPSDFHKPKNRISPEPSGTGNTNGNGRNGPNPNGASGISSNDPKVVPQTPTEYYKYLDNFIDKNLGPFGFDENTKQHLAHRAAEVAEELKSEYGLRDDEVPKLARLSLFDIFILCDNSGSMKQGNRIQALNQTLQNIADWATRIEKDGIFLRFLNGNQDQNGLFDGLTDPNKIDDLIGTVKIRGNTRLGSVLSDKVVTPLARKAARRKRTREQIKPRIVMIITDGKPVGERQNCLRDTILDAKTGKDLFEYGKMATVFIISRVGHDEAAMEFIEGLSADDQISDMMVSSSSCLDQVMEDLVEQKDHFAYKRYLLRMFLAAVDGQTM